MQMLFPLSRILSSLFCSPVGSLSGMGPISHESVEHSRARRTHYSVTSSRTISAAPSQFAIRKPSASECNSLT